MTICGGMTANRLGKVLAKEDGVCYRTVTGAVNRPFYLNHLLAYLL